MNIAYKLQPNCEYESSGDRIAQGREEKLRARAKRMIESERRAAHQKCGKLSVYTHKHKYTHRLKSEKIILYNKEQQSQLNSHGAKNIHPWICGAHAYWSQFAEFSVQ